MDLRHYIIKSIRSYYKRKLAAPIIFLAALVLLSFIFPIRSILAPKNITDSDSIETLYSKRVRYVSGTFTNAYFTGYRKRFMNRTNGYYYYVMHGDECIILLLKPDTCQSGEPKLDQVTINAKIIRNSHSEKELLKILQKIFHGIQGDLRIPFQCACSLSLMEMELLQDYYGSSIYFLLFIRL